MKEEQLIEKLWKQGKIYLVENNNEGCFQLALQEGSEPDPANDPVWELEVVEYSN